MVEAGAYDSPGICILDHNRTTRIEILIHLAEYSTAFGFTAKSGMTEVALVPTRKISSATSSKSLSRIGRVCNMTRV